MPRGKKCVPQTILGIDPGFAITGYGLIRHDREGLHYLASGAITSSAHQPFGERLDRLYRDMTSLLKRHQPDIVVIEELFFAKNVTTALKVSHARGVLQLAAWRSGCAVLEFTPLQIKQALTGYGRASKQQIGSMVRAMLRLKNITGPDDVSDALAIAICGATTKQFG